MEERVLGSKSGQDMTFFLLVSSFIHLSLPSHGKKHIRLKVKNVKVIIQEFKDTKYVLDPVGLFFLILLLKTAHDDYNSIVTGCHADPRGMQIDLIYPVIN